MLIFVFSAMTASSKNSHSNNDLQALQNLSPNSATAFAAPTSLGRSRSSGIIKKSLVDALLNYNYPINSNSSSNSNDLGQSANTNNNINNVVGLQPLAISGTFTTPISLGRSTSSGIIRKTSVTPNNDLPSAIITFNNNDHVNNATTKRRSNSTADLRDIGINALSSVGSVTAANSSTAFAATRYVSMVTELVRYQRTSKLVSTVQTREGAHTYEDARITTHA